MNREESIEQLNNLIEAWALNEADLNQLDIDALKLIIQENENLQSQLSQKNKKAQEVIDLINNILKNPESYNGKDNADNILLMLNEILEEENK